MKYFTFIDRLYPFMEADGKGGGADPQDDPNDESKEEEQDESKEEPKDEKKFTEDEVNALIDKTINARLARWKADEAKRLEEAKKLAGMSAAEKAEHQMAEAIKRAEEAEAKLSHMSMTREARAILQEKSITLSDELLEVLVGDDAESTKKNIDDFSEMFTKAVEAEVKKRLRGKTPKASGGKTTTMTKEEIMAIKDPVLRRKAIAENMSLFE